MTITTLPLSKIEPGANPRRFFDPAAHDELVASIRLRGVLQPLLVRPFEDVSGNVRVVAGDRRRRAAIEALGADGEVPVLIRTMTDQEALEAAIDENEVRDDMSETEQADAAVRVLAACAGDRAEAAARLAWSPSKLARRLALAELTETVKTALDERRIKVGHAELLAAVPADKQDKALATILDAGLDVNATRAVLQRMTLSLGAAQFDKGECATCPFNSARQIALFAVHVDDGHCTNPGCYQIKTEEADKLRAEAEAATETEPGAASPASDPAAMPAPQRSPSAPVSSPAPSPAQGSDPAPAKPTKAASTKPAAPKVTAQSLAAKVKDFREEQWRIAVGAAIYDIEPLLTDESQPLATALDLAIAYVREAAPFGRVTELADEFKVDLRATWQIDGAFLGRFDKDQLKFIAGECGLIGHLGARVFGNLLKGKPHELIAGMIHAQGFDWAGRLPSAITLDGTYGPPPEQFAENAKNSAPEPEDTALVVQVEETPSC